MEDIEGEADESSTKYTNVDEILQDLGANGPFQWVLLATLLVIHIPGNILS